MLEDEAAFIAGMGWWCDSTLANATGGIYGAVDRCYWPLGTTVTELAVSASARCPPFSLASPLDVLLIVVVHFQWWIGLCLAFLQWYGVGVPNEMYYRIAVGLGSLFNLGASFLVTRFVFPEAAPYWPTCGTEFAFPAFSAQTAAFFTGIFALSTTHAGGCSTYQLAVASLVMFLVPLSRIALGYNSAEQALGGAVFGVTLAIVVDAVSVFTVDAIRRARSRRLSPQTAGSRGVPADV